jgi:uncharacterized protein (DUF849 family)
MTDRELLQQALDVIEEAQTYTSCETFSPSMTKECAITAEAIRTKLAQPESVEWKVWTVHNHIFFSIGVQTFQINDVLEHEPEVSVEEFSEWLATQLRHALTQLSNTAQPKKEWVGLTDDEYEAMAEQYVTNCYFDTLEYAKAIEAKLKEKNT